MSQGCVPSCRLSQDDFGRRLRSRRQIIPILGTIALAACGGGEGNGGTTPQAGVLALSGTSLSAGEADGVITITVTRTGGSEGAVSVTLGTAAGTAAAGLDFTSVTTTVSFAAGDTLAKTVAIPISNDALVEPAETFTVTLSSASGGASLGAAASATITIQDDDTAPSAGHSLNDTGVTTCSNGVNNGLACNDAAAGTDQFPRQDGELGRDATVTATNDGVAGFSFTKLDDGGAPLPDQSVAFNVRPWACLLDGVTGLVWEVKTDDDGLRDKDWRYSWFDSSGIADGGGAGTENRGACVNTSDCDTEKYRDAINAAALCGRTDWRLPARSELLSILRYGSSSAPFVDTDFFPQSLNVGYWSGSARGSEAWAVALSSGDAGLVAKDAARAARLVSDGGGL